MNVLRVTRFAIPILAITLAQCSGGSAQHGSGGTLPPSTHILRPMIGGGCTCNEYPDGTLAVWDDNHNKIYLYEGPITSTSTPTATITTPTHNGDAEGGMAFDPSGNLWVSYYDPDAVPAANEILEYAAPLTTGESPSVTISGSNTGLSAPSGISYNQSTNKIFVSDPSLAKVFSWSSSASGNVSPSTTISSTSLGGAGIKTDANNIYVSDVSSGIDEFSLSSSGSVSPTTTFLSGQKGWLDFDVEGNIYTWNSLSGNVRRYLLDNSWSGGSGFTEGSSSFPMIAVDDAGYVYTADYDNVYITKHTGGTTPDVDLSVGSTDDIVAIALYSPGRFNSAAPQ